MLGPASLVDDGACAPLDVAEARAGGDATGPVADTRVKVLLSGVSRATEDEAGAGARERRPLDIGRSRATLDAREEVPALARGSRAGAAAVATVEVGLSLVADAAAEADGPSAALVAQRGARGGLIAGRGQGLQCPRMTRGVVDGGRVDAGVVGG